MKPQLQSEPPVVRVAAAWNTRDAERVLAYFADDCVYHASFGPELLGRSYVGRAEVLDGIRQFFENAFRKQLSS